MMISCFNNYLNCFLFIEKILLNILETNFKAVKISTINFDRENENEFIIYDEPLSPNFWLLSPSDIGYF